MFRMKTLLLCLSLALTLPSLFGAEEEGSDEARKAKGRQAWFVYTSLPEGLENPVSVMSGKEVSQVLLCRLNPSDPVKIPADGTLRIVRKIENPKDPTKPGYLTLAQAVVPDTVSKAMIILMPVATNQSGLLFQAKVQDLAALKGGDNMFLNMTKLKIGVELGKDKIQIDPGQVKTHNPLGTSKSASLPIRLSFFNPEQQEWEMITASTVALYSTRRELCIFNWNAQFNRVDFDNITLPLMQ